MKDIPERSHKNFSTLVFDCDGVILDSNKIKTEAFREVAERFGSQAADELVEYHVHNGGISRYHKFEYLMVDILGRTSTKSAVNKLASDYGDCVYSGLLTCSVTPGLKELREATKDTTWMIVSGGDQNELRRVFAERELDTLFDSGIYGSPHTKDEILHNMNSDGKLKHPAIFLGDSRYDHEAALNAGIQFVFIHGWTELPEWEKYCKAHGLHSVDYVKNITDII